MSIKVMLVDDSAVIRGLIARALTKDPQIEIVATAGNGEMAIRSAGAYKPDVVILDIEMPVMDGITALPKILEAAPGVRVIMASTLTQRNANISIQALERGATDYLPKPTSTGDQEGLATFYRELLEKVKTLGAIHLPAVSASPLSATAAASPVKPAEKVITLDTRPLSHKFSAVAIASSTGGPQALQSVFTGLKGSLKHVPIFITQHMPPTFTTILAEHLSKAGDRPCKEAVDHEEVVAGSAYLAPGNFHMVVEKKAAGGGVLTLLNQNPPENFCRPAADPMLRSLSQVYGAGLLTVVLTGMGQDGMEGCKVVVQNNGFVIAQDEASCVVYGMPKAVAENKLCKAVLPLSEIPAYLMKAV